MGAIALQIAIKILDKTLDRLQMERNFSTPLP